MIQSVLQCFIMCVLFFFFNVRPHFPMPMNLFRTEIIIHLTQHNEVIIRICLIYLLHDSTDKHLQSVFLFNSMKLYRKSFWQYISKFFTALFIVHQMFSSARQSKHLGASFRCRCSCISAYQTLPIQGISNWCHQCKRRTVWIPVAQQ